MPVRVLLLAQLAPPSLLTAARRTAGMVKYLDRLGYEVTVVTSLVSGRAGPLPGAVHTIRTRDLMVSGLNWRRGSFERFKSAGSGSYSPKPSRIAEWIPPDLGLVGWAPFALSRALRLASEVDCVVTSAPPFSTHLVGLALHRRGLPWVADFRDGWRFQSGRPAFAAGPLDALDARLERVVARSADRLVAVTEPIAEDLERRFGTPAATITNGFDPEEAAAAPGAGGELRPDRHSLLYTGTLAYAGLTPAPLLDGLRRLRERDAAPADRLELVFAGPLSDEERAQIEAPDLAGSVRTLGMLGRERVLALQRAADGLVVMTGNESGRATGKLYEYLAAGRPILVLGGESAAARIVERAGAGLAVSATDPASIADGLERMLDSSVQPDREAVEQFSWPVLAGRLADQIELALRSIASTSRQ